MEQGEIDQIVREVFSCVLQRKIKKEEIIDRKNEPLWDSLKHVELIFMIEERFGIRFSESQMTELSGLEGIIGCIMDSYET